MIYFRGEPLLPSGVNRRRKCAANIACDDAVDMAQLRQRPFQIVERESTAFPVGYCVFGAQTIEIDRHVDRGAGQICHERKESPLPVQAHNRSSAFARRRGPFVRPWMHLESAFTLGAPIAEDLSRPPAFKITATPHAHLLYAWQFQSAIHPASTAPPRRANIPVWMIIE